MKATDFIEQLTKELQKFDDFVSFMGSKLEETTVMFNSNGRFELKSSYKDEHDDSVCLTTQFYIEKGKIKKYTENYEILK